MPQFEIESLRQARIHLRANAHPAVAFAAAELRRYLQRLTAIDVPIQAQSETGGRTTISIGLSPVAGSIPRLRERGAFAIRPDARQISLFGGSPRATLQAAYRLLEDFGCVWSLHDPSEEVIADHRATRHLDLAEVSHTPAFRLHGYCSDIMTWHYTQPEYLHERLPDDRNLIDWMGKSGATTFFYIRHPFDSQLMIPELAADFAQRAIDVEYGGHVLPQLLPRERFADHPEYFPQGPNGARSDHGNLCSSNPAGLQVAADNAVAYVREHAEMSALHIWGADLWKGGWCRCASCADVSAQDQSLLVCNAVAQGLVDAGVTRPLCYLAYHDTLDANLSVRPLPQVVCEWAPRERCYGHSIDDPDCERNQRYRISLERYLQLFDGRVRLFEYYGDSILFFGCSLPLTALIDADMAYYRRLGVREALMLQFGTYSTRAHGINYLAFAAAATGTRATPADIRRSYCARFAAQAGMATQAFASIEQCMAQVVRYGDIRLPPRTASAAQATAESIARVLPQLQAVAESLRIGESPELRAQADLLRYTRTVLAGVATEIEQRHSADAIFESALNLIANLDRRFKGLWGAVDLPIIHNFYAAAAHMGDDMLQP